MSGIAKKYGYKNVQEFYRIYYKSCNAYADYKEQEAEWDKTYGESNYSQGKESVYEQLKNRQRKQRIVNSNRYSEVKAEGQDSLLVFTIYNNFLTINAKECGMMDLWMIVYKIWRNIRWKVQEEYCFLI